MRLRGAVLLGVLVSLILLICVMASVVLWRHPELLGIRSGSGQQASGLLTVLGGTLLSLLLLTGYRLMGHQMGRRTYRMVVGDDSGSTGQSASQSSVRQKGEVDIANYLRDHYGYFWKQKVRLLLVVGEPEQIEAVAPGLAESMWLEGPGVVLLRGAGLGGEWDAAVLELLRRLRPLDGIVWALSEKQRDDLSAMSTGVRQLRNLGAALHWQAPLYLWQVCASAWAQTARATQPVGCLFPPRASAAQIEASLRELPAPLRRQGMEQLLEQTPQDFLLRLCRDLERGGIAHWCEALAPFLGDSTRSLPLRGLLFSLPLAKTEAGGPHAWWPNANWQGVVDDRQVRGQRLGWSWPRAGHVLALGLVALWGLGLLLSFASNRSQIADAQASLTALRQPGSLDSQLSALNELTRELARLDHRAVHGVPWFQSFGLSQNDALLAALWPHYTWANHRLLRDVAAKGLERQLIDLAALPPDSPERASRVEDAHDQLKAYLMMARPDKAEPAFLTQVLARNEAERPGVSPGLWQGLAPGLWAFYAEHLPAHPEWRIQANPDVVAQARQVLLGQLGQRNGVANLYQQVLDRASNQYAALSLMDMVGDTEAPLLFDSARTVPGVFTRQAWEGQVREAIDAIAEARREEIDWVLSDQQGSVARELQPAVLKVQLTERYFQDFSDAWLAFLNSLRWRPADDLPAVIDQLTLLSDVRQSPLIALMNTLAYQGQTGVKGEALADSLMKSAQQLLDQEQQPVIDQQASGPRGPMDETFAPLLALLGKGPEATAKGADALSLQAFLTRVTRVRLKLQQIINAADPQAMTQALAQTVFQGKSIDLTDTRDYGSLMAASLGAQWSGFGQSLFVQPLSQAWAGVLQPSAQSLNRQWQRAIVAHWNSAFDNRYPFAATGSDASLPMLGQMIRAGSGRIDQFLTRELGGLLHKEGHRWVADAASSQGLHFNPQFLQAINQLGALADLLYTDDGLGLTFQLRAKPVRDVVRTTFILDGKTLDYFNQQESWHHFNWPGSSDHPGTQLSWIGIRSGARLFGDYPGTWGLIRLLEQARVTPLDDSDTRFQLVLTAPDGLPLTWQLRTELSRGPLALLQLRGFKLPERIFEGTAPQAEPYALNEGFE